MKLFASATISIFGSTGAAVGASRIHCLLDSLQRWAAEPNRDLAGRLGPVFAYLVPLLPAAAKPHRNLVRAVGTACFAYPIRVGRTTTGADAIGIETRNVGDRDSQHAIAVDVDAG